MVVFTIQNEGLKSYSNFSKDLTKWLQIPENTIKEYLKYNDMSLNVSEHYFKNFYVNFLEKELNVTLDEFKKMLNNEEYNNSSSIEQIDTEAMLESITNKYKVSIFILEAII